MLLTVKQVAERMNVSRGKVTTMLQTGQLDGINLNPGGQNACWRVDSSDLEAFINDQRTPRVKASIPDIQVTIRPEPRLKFENCVSVRQQRKLAGR